MSSWTRVPKPPQRSDVERSFTAPTRAFASRKAVNSRLEPRDALVRGDRPFSPPAEARPVEALKAGVENLSVDSSAGSPVQAKVKIGRTTYPDDESRREFNRTLMLQLKANKFKDLGTKAMWKYVCGLVDDKKLGESRKYTSWKVFIEQLWENGYLERMQRGSSMGPKNLGARPTFTTATQKAVTLEEGEHRRHIISSSSLGKGIEVAYGLLKAQNTGDNAGKTLETLNAWNSANGGETCDSEYRALRMMWTTVHNHTGNLFPGEGAANSAIGFVRTPLSALLQDLKKREAEAIKVEDIVKAVKDIKPSMAWLKKRWIEITNTLADTLMLVDPVVSSIGLSAAYIRVSQKSPGDDSVVDRIYRELERAFGVNSTMRSTDLIADLETILQNKNYQFLKPEIRQEWRTQIELFALGQPTISGAKAYELVDEWIRNCDLDYPFELVEEDPPPYYQALVAIYHQVMNPGTDFFNLDGPLAAFMELDFRA